MFPVRSPGSGRSIGNNGGNSSFSISSGSTRKSVSQGTTDSTNTANTAGNNNNQSAGLFNSLSSSQSSSQQQQQSIPQLTQSDAYRFRATLEEAVERLELLGLITAESLRKRTINADNNNNNSNNNNNNDNNTSSTSAAGGRNRADIVNLVRKQRELESQYSLLQSKRNELRGLANKSKFLANQAELKSIENQLKESNQTIHFNLRDQPTVMGNLNKLHRERQLLQSLLNNLITELSTNNGTFQSLIIATNNIAAEQRLLPDTKLRTEKTAAALRSLESELDREWREFELLEESKNQLITNLTAELKHQKLVQQLTLKFEQQTALAKQETIARLRAGRLESLRMQINAAKAIHRTDKRVNKRTMNYLTADKESMDQLYEQWESKYQSDYSAISTEYQSLTDNRNTAQIVLIENQQRWESNTANKIELVLEAEKRGADTIAAKLELDRRTIAACRIQFAWRVYWRRRRKQLKKLRRKYLSRLRAERAADSNPMIQMQQRKAAAAAEEQQRRSASNSAQSTNRY